MFDANYPERLEQVVIYPPPPWISKLLNGIFRLLPESISSKVPPLH